MATVAPSHAVRTATAPARGRLDSIDLLRGIVMVVMVIDHTRDFVHASAFRYDPTDLAHASAAVFMTRWVTHFCAPVFVFLAGVSAYLQKMRGKSVSDLSRFLVTRGIWLIAVEVLVLHVLVWFSFDFASFLGLMQVIWAIGWSMIALAGLVYLPLRTIAAFGIGMIVLHNSLDGIQVPPWTGPASSIPSAAGKLWMALHQAGLTPILGAGSPLVMFQYPLIPWIGVMAAGYAFGSLYELDAPRRIRIVRQLGLSAIAAFVLIRATNLYGDPSPWSVQPTLLFTVLSFINTTKYPPSLLYLLMTLGPSLVALAWFESRTGPAAPSDGGTGPAALAVSPPHRGTGSAALPVSPPHRGTGSAVLPVSPPHRGTGSAVLPVPQRRGPVAALLTFGRVPLFFYLWQWVLAHSAAIVANMVAGRSFGYLFLTPPALFAAMARNGFRLWIVYLCWACIIAVEYPLCLWFAGVKRRRRDWWLSYL